jgi:hypothetical protein
MSDKMIRRMRRRNSFQKRNKNNNQNKQRPNLIKMNNKKVTIYANNVMYLLRLNLNFNSI